MLRSRMDAQTMFARIARLLKRAGMNETEPQAPAHLSALAEVIHERMLADQPTTLRQLHKISDLSQPQALGVMAELERAGIIRIERNMADAFESVITLTPRAQARFSRRRSRKAA
ncbi:hypothetical protein [Qipengyuania nanhaisediminis]|uniref:hypothetical protein n=1 Tax=Qipengyuania nanhaisediminis TaxID=604088 RepID=UPI0038B2F65D